MRCGFAERAHDAEVGQARMQSAGHEAYDFCTVLIDELRIARFASD